MEKELPADVIDAANSVLKLETMLTGEQTQEAIAKAVEAGIRQYGARVTEMIARAAEMYADEFVEGEEDSPEGATLKWFAEKLRGDIGWTPDTKTYEPHNDDIAEVTVSGVVTTYSDKCEDCGEPIKLWSVIDDGTGEEYLFNEEDLEFGLQVRVLHRADDPLS